MLTVLVSTISNSQVLLLKKCECKSYSKFFRKDISEYAIFNDNNFNETLTNDIVSFEQLGLECFQDHIMLLPRCLGFFSFFSFGSNFPFLKASTGLPFNLRRSANESGSSSSSSIFTKSRILPSFPSFLS